MRVKEIIEKLKYTMRFSILFVFISLFVTSIVILTLIIYFRFSQSISQVAFQFMEQASIHLYDEIETEFHDISVGMDMFENMIRGKTINPDNIQELIDYMTILIKIESKLTPSLQGVYFADKTGSFFMVRKYKNEGVEIEIMNRRQTPYQHWFLYYDRNGKLIQSTRSNDFQYDPRVRPWYIVAMNEKKFSWTDIYPYHLTNYLGITAAKPIYFDNGELRGIIAFNLRLDYIRRFIENMYISSHGIIYLINLNGKVIAFPHVSQYQAKELISIQELKLPWLTASFNEYKKHFRNHFTFYYEGEKYLAIYRPFPQLGKDKQWMIGMVAPEKDFISELIKANFLVMIISLIILLAGIFLMSKLVNKIVHPLKEVINETERIKHFELNDTPPLHSRIKEIEILSQAIYRMKQGLRTFKKYVPANLVRQLIDSGRDVLIGGEKKQLAIFFSDIENFTSLAERSDPDELMEQICEYFNELSLIIVSEQGTIDKYIGDSIMAFWGAPLEVENPCHLAAKAALRVTKRVKELNETWVRNGKSPFHTRIGLHFGDAIVGNIGSNERLNYTALGDAINTTNRLENINKFYRTQIMTSETFYRTITDTFVLRFIDSIALKGKMKGTNIYELLAEHNESLSFHLVDYQNQYAKGFAAYKQQKWDLALSYFNSCLAIYPADTVAPIFIIRCQYFKMHPPSVDWDGIWKMQEK